LDLNSKLDGSTRTLGNMDAIGNVSTMTDVADEIDELFNA
jgi:hypothetical protein